MTGFDDLNLKIPLIMAISIFISSLNFMLMLSMKKFHNLGTGTFVKSDQSHRCALNI